MPYNFQKTGEKKTDQAIEEIARVLNWLKSELDKKADGKLLKDLLQFMTAHEQTLMLVRYRRDGTTIIREFDSNYGVGVPSWVEWDRLEV